MENKVFHGTSTSEALSIASPKGISVSMGGGELGQGFYTTIECYVAFGWAANKHGRNHDVVEIDIPSVDFDDLEIEILLEARAKRVRIEIKELGETRTYNFGVDAVWGPIVGRSVGSDQIKFESNKSEYVLNRSNKRII